MQFLVSDLEREAVNYDVSLSPNAIDFGGEAQQIGELTSAGRAEVLHEHRGPKEIVADIRLKGNFSGEFETPCARCIDPVRSPLAGEFDLLFRPAATDAQGNEHAISTPETEI